MGFTLSSSARRLHLASVDATRALGMALGRTARPGDVLWLEGDLGAGKTSLAQGIAAGLGIEESITSPTFALVHEHDEARVPLVHLDLYRLETSRQAPPDLEEAWDRPDAVVLVEWPERLEVSLPPGLVATLAWREEGRDVHLEPRTDRAAAWVQQALGAGDV